MSEAKYYCKKCDADIKSTDEKCTNCGSILKKVGRHIKMTLEDRIVVSDELKLKLNKIKNILTKNQELNAESIRRYRVAQVKLAGWWIEFQRVKLKEKKNPSALSKIRFENFREGLSAQIMHIGPYSAEGPNIEKFHSFIKGTGHELRGRHHEIYLSDPRRSAPERMKTVIRQPIK